MPDAATSPPPPAPRLIDEDPRFARNPMVRYAMTILVPVSENPTKFARIAIREWSSGGIVEINDGDSGIERSIRLNVRELRQLADHCNRIARRVANRPETRP